MPPLGRRLKSPRSLLIFEAAARLGSCSAAAREFNLTQPSVSRNIAELEEQLAATLFVRSPAGLTLTPDGQKLYGTVNDALQRIGQTMREIGKPTVRKHVVELSLSTAFVAHWFIPRMGRFQSDFPDVDLRFQLISGTLKGPIGSVDLAMRRCGRDELDEWTVEFAPEIVVPVCSSKYLGGKGRLDDGKAASAGHVLLQLSDAEIDWHAVLAKGELAAVPQGNWIEFTDYAVVLQAALSGQGVAPGWISVVSRNLLEGTLVPASRHHMVTGQVFCLTAHRSRPLRSIVLRIRDWIIDEMRRELESLADSYGARRSRPRKRSRAARPG